MPTAVGTARQCLAADAASSLDDAVAVAKRRSHAQTTSLHVILALLSSPSLPLLRDALSRVRTPSVTCSPRLHFKALELCFSVALDRLPSSAPPSSDDPPVSNSLMAAIKRSQANQRRHPDTFHFYQQQQMMMTSSSSSSSSTSSFSGVKVELQQLVLAILDDPVVSRVFGEAGFCSPDIKLAVLRPPTPILRFPRSARCPPLFLCNFDVASSVGGGSDDDSCRRIGEVLARSAARNPMLVGVGAASAAADFIRAVESRNWAILPPEVAGLRYASLEIGDQNRLEELGRKAEKPGVVVGIGDLKGLVDLGEEVVNCLVSEMTRVLEAYKGRIWVMGWSATYETYMKFLSRFPMLDRDWDLQLLPITSQRAGGVGLGGGLLARPQSLMESFVPFGGFFATAYESPSPVSKLCQSSPRCHSCNDQYQQELASILKECSPPLEDQNQANLPSWLRKVDMASTTKAKDEKVLDTKIFDLQKKWNDHCQRLGHGLLTIETSKCPVLPPIVGLPFVSDRMRLVHQTGQNPAVSQSQSGISSTLPMTVGLPLPMAVGLPNIPAGNIPAVSLSISLPMASEPVDKDFISKLQVRVPEREQLPKEGFQSHQSAPSDLSTQDDHTSPTSVTSVTTDLVLGTLCEPSCAVERATLSKHNGCSNDLSRNLPAKVSSGSLVCPSTFPKLDTNNFKAFYRGLLEKVGRQEEAVCAISSAILRCKTGLERRLGTSLKGGIWVSFHGPDRFGKKRAAAALAELVFGNRENLICVDFGYQEGFVRANTICDTQQRQKYDAVFRGKTVADYIAVEISKKPLCVVFLENIEKADLLVQSSLSHAIHTGKIRDSHGREFSISNAIFVTSTKALRGKNPSPRKETARFTEEMILEAQAWQLKILVETTSEPVSISSFSKRKIDISSHQAEQPEHSGMKRVHKNPAALLDLNLPVDEAAEKEAADCSSTTTGSSDEAWVEEFLSLMDESVNFKPFDFDALADYVTKQIGKRSRDIMGAEGLLEIDPKAMQQILASAWLLEDVKDMNSWFDDVIGRSFIELRRRYSNKLSTRAALRLVAAEELLKEEFAPGLLLPSKIILD